MITTVELRLDPAFVEEAVFLELKRLASSGETELSSAFHAERTALYEVQEEHEREAAFHRLMNRYFQSLGLSELFNMRWEEFPKLSEHIDIAVLRRVFSRKEERVEFYRGRASDGLSSFEVSTSLLIGLQAARCLDRKTLIAFLRHELMHVADMIDPAFSYDPHAVLGGENKAEDELIRERFRLLWDLWVHRRMKQFGWQTVVDDTARRREFERAFSAFDPARREEIFRVVDRQDRWTHQELLRFMQDERLTRRTFLKSAPRHLLDGVRGFYTEVTARGSKQRVAILDVSRCLAWGEGECQLCYLRCPLRDKAMLFDAGKPTIVASACDGCGICADVCRTANDLQAIQLAEKLK